MRRILNRLAVLPVLPYRARSAALNALGCDIDESVRLSPGIVVTGPQLTIGAGSFVGADVFFDTDAEIVLGHRVHVGPYARFVTQSHDFGPSAQRAGAQVCAPIDVGDGAWIGAQAVVLGGVTIGAGAVVAAGAVVISDCDADTLYAGAPAEAKRRLEAP